MANVNQSSKPRATNSPALINSSPDLSQAPSESHAQPKALQLSLPVLLFLESDVKAAKRCFYKWTSKRSTFYHPLEVLISESTYEPRLGQITAAHLIHKPREEGLLVNEAFRIENPKQFQATILSDVNVLGIQQVYDISAFGTVRNISAQLGKRDFRVSQIIELSLWLRVTRDGMRKVDGLKYHNRRVWIECRSGSTYGTDGIWFARLANTSFSKSPSLFMDAEDKSWGNLGAGKRE
ncbi:hypothetical protein F5876DRAFT_68729 [Lentinula aff. lateritia]|uniref:Uncharacterized protein n=1 Tax=Lentinula aff. lateritia TaxID=2804960 RepID=A0ACC1TPX8_9AGAR|nr:hypothetical protein F5876DRAFT_68729 [Lentinula aff. lateritia]